MDINQSKKTIENLLSKSKANTGVYDANSTFHNLVQPFFESLEWDFKSNVVDCNDDSDSAADKEFQIDGITKFFLKIIPHGTSIESSRNEITSLTTLAYNQGVTWAIATNFQETRVYNTEAPGNTLKSMEHYSFTENQYISKFDDLLDLTPHQFSRNILDSNAEWLGSKPKRIPIDKQLLKDLLSFRNLLVINIVNNNSIKNEEAEYAAQKILNRLIFIRSCGDRQIEQRHLKSSLSDWEKNKNKTLMQYLQDIFNHFNDIYGSTLFQKHSCDSLIISDGILEDIINGLYKSKEKAVKYNFAKIQHDSLGKMYENYLGTVQQKQDGAYYTPSYISKYICENTIIPYLSKSNTTTILDLLAEYENDLEELELKIHNIKILDPACGTGEFLIRAIDILLEISKQIQRKKELQGKYQTADSTSRKAPRSLKKKKSDLTTFQTFDKDIENQQLRKIIQNNIHGVDINEEAIEITQLNMFLKLATSSQQLIDLSKNILVGNSLIDDPNIDPSAFDWNKKFPGKFDVIVGNPPYVNIQLIDEQEKKFLFKNYKTASGRFDFYVLFYEKSFHLLNEGGFLSFITSNKFFKTKSGKNLRKEFIDNVTIKKIIDFGEITVGRIFEGLTTYPVIITVKKIISNKQTKFEYIKIKSLVNINLHNNEKHSNSFERINIFQNTLTSEKWKFLNKQLSSIYEKIQLTSTIKLRDISQMMYAGLITGDNKTFFLSNEKIKKYNIEKELLQPLPKANNVRRFHIEWKNDSYVLYPYKTEGQNSISVINLDDYPNTKKYLLMFKKSLESRKSLQNTNKKWFELMRPRKFHWFQNKKIITPNLSKVNNFSLDFDETIKNNFFVDHDAYGIILKNDDDKNYYYVLGILNSKLIDFFIKQTSPVFSGGYYKYHNQYFDDIPIIQNNPNLIKKCVDLVKKIIQNKILKKSTDLDEKDLDQLVYELYNITDEEKVIIESSI